MSWLKYLRRALRPSTDSKFLPEALNSVFSVSSSTFRATEGLRRDKRARTRDTSFDLTLVFSSWWTRSGSTWHPEHKKTQHPWRQDDVLRCEAFFLMLTFSQLQRREYRRRAAKCLCICARDCFSSSRPTLWATEGRWRDKRRGAGFDFQMFLLSVISPDTGVTSRPERSSYIREHLNIYILYLTSATLGGLFSKGQRHKNLWKHAYKTTKSSLKAVVISSSLTQTPQVPGSFLLSVLLHEVKHGWWNHFFSIRKSRCKSKNQTRRHISELSASFTLKKRRKETEKHNFCKVIIYIIVAHFL